MSIFSNLTPEHLDFHGNMENYFKTKLELFKKLNKNSIAIINGDDEYSKDIIDNINCNYLSYGFNNKCDLSLI